MNIMVPYVTLHPALPDVLKQQELQATFVNTAGFDGYWNALNDWWHQGETFIVLEQDKIPAPGALLELWSCPGAWCTYPVSMQNSGRPAPYPSLACTKFDRSLMVARPGMFDDIGCLDLGLGEHEWSRLDLAIAGWLEGMMSVRPHWHEAGRVEHRHELVAA